jgi:hypothetical protein
LLHNLYNLTEKQGRLAPPCERVNGLGNLISIARRRKPLQGYVPKKKSIAFTSNLQRTES